MKFAVFDLDHTLLPVDSGENWSRWLVRAAGMDVALMAVSYTHLTLPTIA